MPTRVLLLRHAETAVPHVFHGAESDVDLSERGQRQAACIAPLLAEERPVALISSGMRRALATAAPIAAACRLTVQVEPALHERRVGALCGTSFHADEGVWPDTLRRWVAGETSFAPDGAESFEAIRTRVLPIWERLTTCYANQTMVMVAHGIVNKVLLLSLIDGWSVQSWHTVGALRNVAINELTKAEGVWRVVRLNELPPTLQALSSASPSSPR